MMAQPTFKISRQWFKWQVALEDQAPKPPLPAEQRLRVGVVGGGDIGLRNAICVRTAAGADVAAVCDRSPEVLRDLARQFEVPALREYEELLARDDINAVLLSLPHMLHAPLAIQAVQAGKHILLEKPLGVNLGDATRIVEACRQAGVRLTVNFSYRYRPAIMLAREMIQAGVLGEVCGTQISFHQFKGASYWAGGFTARASGDWRASREQAGGGVLIITICHHVDFVRYCTGLDVKRVSSEYGTLASPVEVEDVIAVTMQHTNGAIGSLSGSSVWRAAPVDEVRIWGTQGALVITGGSQLSFWSGRRWRDLAAGKTYHLDQLPVVDYTARWIEDFAYAVANDEPHAITGRDGWINNAVIEAAYRSCEQGTAVAVDAWPWPEEEV
jgi:predicted dehydrogenase